MSDKVNGAAPVDISSVDMGGMFGEDAVTLLARHLTLSGVRLNKKSVKALIFIEMYLGRDGQSLTERVMGLKIHQMQNASRHYREAIQAIGLKELWSKINLNLGGK